MDDPVCRLFGILSRFRGKQEEIKILIVFWSFWNSGEPKSLLWGTGVVTPRIWDTANQVGEWDKGNPKKRSFIHF